MNPTQPNTTPSQSGFNRRSFLQKLGFGAGAAALPAVLTMGTGNAKADLELDLAILNFALNFEYLEAEYYTRGTTGLGLDDFKIPTGGTGTAGTVTIKPNAMVTFDDPTIAAYANEIAADERAHVVFVRDTINALGGDPISRPSTDYLNSFNTVAVKGNIDSSFDPFANQANFLLGGFTFSDVTVTALHGAAGLLTNAAVKSGSAGILGTEGYHAGLLRYNLFKLGSFTQMVAGKISDLRDSLDGNSNKDEGVVNADGTPNIVSADANSIAFARTPKKVLNIVYGAKNAQGGLFFPNGVNGTL